MLTLVSLVLSSCVPEYDYPSYNIYECFFVENNSETPVIIEFYRLVGWDHTSDTARWNEYYPFLCPVEEADIDFEWESSNYWLVQRCKAVILPDFPRTEIFHVMWWGTDCSGFLQLIYGAFGYWLPSGSASYQYYVGKEVSWAQIQPGDILVYDWGEHVGIYAGDGLLVHCSSPENGTVVWPCNYRLVTKIVSVLPDPEPIEPAR